MVSMGKLSSNDSILVDGNSAGILTDASAQRRAFALHSCGTVSDFHQTFPVSFSS